MRRLVIAVLLSLVCSQANAATSVTKGNIRWTFDDDYTVGTFVTGDYYVVAPYGMQITGITALNGETLAGSQVNPRPIYSQGLVASPSSSVPLVYDSALNAGLSLPISLSGGDNIVTTTAYSFSTTNQTDINEAAILTVVTSSQASTAFRPGLCATTPVIYDSDDIDYTLLKTFTPVSGAPTQADLEDLWARPWIDFYPSWPGRSIHPYNNMKDYGGRIAADVSASALFINSNYTQAQKEPIVIGMIQYGIDIYSAIQYRVSTYDQTVAHMLGRKFPFVLAGELLDIAGIKALYTKAGVYTHSGGTYYPSDAVRFEEDQCITYVTQRDVDETESGTAQYKSTGEYSYTTAMIGMPEFFHHKISDRDQGNASWTGDPYRTAYYPGVMYGTALAVLMMDLETEWNHQAFFDYLDRADAIMTGASHSYETVPNETTGSRLDYASSWCINMWDTYIDDYEGTCASTSSACDNQTDCENASWYWYDAVCNSNPEGYPGPSASNFFPTAEQAAGTTGGTLSFNSDEASTWRYSTNAAHEWADMTAMSTTGSTTHSQAVTGWTDGSSTTYYFIGQDSNSNESEKESLTVTVASETDICSLTNFWRCETDTTCEAITGLYWWGDEGDEHCYTIAEPIDWEGNNLFDIDDAEEAYYDPSTVIISGNTVTVATNSSSWPPAAIEYEYGDGVDDVEYRYTANIEYLTDTAEVYTPNEGSSDYTVSETVTGVVTSNSEIPYIYFQATAGGDRTVRFGDIYLKKVTVEQRKQLRGVSGSFSTR